MEANELRIGNYILSPDTGKFVKVEVGHLLAIQEATTFNGKSYERLPLTEEWLEKFGFENKGKFVNKVRLSGSYPGNMDGATEYLKQLEWATVFIKDGKFYYEISNCSDDVEDTIETREMLYVHQIQNLHYALTGEELKINSEKTANID